MEILSFSCLNKTIISKSLFCNKTWIHSTSWHHKTVLSIISSGKVNPECEWCGFVDHHALRTAKACWKQNKILSISFSVTELIFGNNNKIKFFITINMHLYWPWFIKYISQAKWRIKQNSMNYLETVFQFRLKATMLVVKKQPPPPFPILSLLWESLSLKTKLNVSAKLADKRIFGTYVSFFHPGGAVIDAWTTFTLVIETQIKFSY